MKFHALALTIAATLAASAACAEDRDVTVSSASHVTIVHTNQWPCCREVLYPDMPSLQEVADKVAAWHAANAREAAEMRALSTRARSDGFENISVVYEHLARDHDRGAEMTGTWLASWDRPGPPIPTVTLASDITPRSSIDPMLDHHMRSHREAAEKLKTEKSLTVRGLHLMTLATTSRHISVLQALDRDVDRGRTTTSAYLQGLLENRMTASASEEWVNRTIIEETEFFSSRTTIYPQVAIDAPAEETYSTEPRVVERIVEREVIVEVPVVRIVEKPVYVERVVEKPVYITRPVVRSRVAGRRQSTRMMGARARMRRPAR